MRILPSPGKQKPRNQRPLKVGAGLVLSLGFIVLSGPGPLLLPASAKATTNAWPMRNFLPPIASINPKWTEQAAHTKENDLEPVALSAVTSPAIRTSPKVNRLATKLDVTNQNAQVQALQDIQKKVDEADLESLWRATVEKNPVIRFSLEKLATPPDLQKKQSSKFLSKTLSLMISGATMGATMLPGASAYRNMGAMGVGQALQNISNGTNKPAPNTLSATEQIQLAGLIDELKGKLIQNYQDYKNTLQALAEAREITIRNNNIYSKALAAKNDLGIMAAGSAYYQALIHETALKEKAKLYRLKLERIAGMDAVSHLELTAQVSTSAKTSSSEVAPTDASAKLSTSAEVLPQKPTTETTESPQAMMEIGPHMGSDSDTLIGPPLPTISSNKRQKRVKSKQAAVKNMRNDSIPQPIPDKIMEHPVAPPFAEEKP